jgi:iron complex outermembrane recepter protein
MNRFTLLPLAATLIASASIAGEDEEGTPLDEIIVSAAPLDRSADDLTQSAIVLSRDDLLLKAEASIGETLANELGVSATYFGPVAGRPVIRGQAGPRVSVLAGGISALDISDLSPDHAVSIEPLFADRIEVMRGPATLLYGSSAAGGVVNVIDNRIPETLTESPINGAFELRGDTAAEERTALGRLDGSTGRIAWHLDAVSRQTEDIDIPDFATADPSVRPVDEERGTVLNSAGDSQGYAGGISVIGDKGFIGVSLSGYESDYGLPGPEEAEPGAASEPLIATGPFIELEQTRFDLRSEYAFDSTIETLRFRFGINDYEHAEIEPTGEVATQFENDAWEGRLELVHAPLKNWRGAVGLQVNDRDFSAVGEEAFVPPTQSESYGFFVLEERNLSAGRIEFGVRIESLKHNPTAGLQGYDETAISLAAGVVWDFATHYDLRMNLSRSERHPDAAELYSNGAHFATALFEVGLLAERSGSVNQEVTTNLDLSVHHHRDAVSWQISVFYNDAADYIFRSQTAVFVDGFPLAPYVQQDAEFYGYEAEIEFPLGSASGSDWDLRLFTDYVRGKTVGGDLPRIQPRRLGAELGYEAPLWSAGVDAIYHTKQDDVSSFQTDSFTMLNTNVVFRPGEGSAIDWQIFLKATNLLDEDARRSPSFRAAFVPLPGASLRAGVRGRFN